MALPSVTSNGCVTGIVKKRLTSLEADVTDWLLMILKYAVVLVLIRASTVKVRAFRAPSLAAVHHDISID